MMLPKRTGRILTFYLIFLIPSDCSRFSLDEDVGKKTTDLIASQGYPVEEHYVVTKDLYVLKMQRIPAGRNEAPHRFKGRKPVVLLNSGVQACSADFVVNMPHQSLAFILADHGFDVWLGNARGTKYSDHLILKKTGRKFWAFSMDEMIKYDVPAQIDYVLYKTGEKSLQYIGFSQGSSILFGLLAERPQYNSKITLFHAMAPAVYLGHMKSSIRLLIPFHNPLVVSPLHLLFISHIGRFRSYTRIADVFMKGAVLGKQDVLFNALKKMACRSRRPRLFCRACFFLLFGGMPVEVNRTRLPVYLWNTPAGGSIRNIHHFAQLSKSNRFQKFDFGRFWNRIKYGKPWPPVYDLRRVRVPVAIYYSDTDSMVDPRDVEHLVNTLPNVVLVYKVPVRGFKHLDFVWSAKAWRHLYRKILQMMTLASSYLNRRVFGHYF